jgi:hypothetical protein
VDNEKKVRHSYVRTQEHKKMMSEIQKEIYRNGKHNNNNPIRNIDKVIEMGKYWLENEYITKRRSTRDIAKELAVYPIDVSKALHFFDLSVRSTCNGKDKSEIEKSMLLLQDYNWIYEKYYINQLSISHISNKLLHLSSCKVKSQLEKFDIPIRSYVEQLSISRKKSCNDLKYKKIISERFINLWNTIEFREKMSNRVYPRGKDHPFYGRKLSNEHKQKLIGRKWSGINYRSQYYEKSDGSTIWLRSSYEVRIAKTLDRLGLAWIYEAKRFSIPELNTTYLPDFYISDIDMWWEIKGYIDDQFKEKYTIFNKIYDIPIKIIKLSDIEYLEGLPRNCDMYDIILAGNSDI